MLSGGAHWQITRPPTKFRNVFLVCADNVPIAVLLSPRLGLPERDVLLTRSFYALVLAPMS